MQWLHVAVVLISVPFALEPLMGNNTPRHTGLECHSGSPVYLPQIFPPTHLLTYPKGMDEQLGVLCDDRPSHGCTLSRRFVGRRAEYYTMLFIIDLVISIILSPTLFQKGNFTTKELKTLIPTLSCTAPTCGRGWLRYGSSCYLFNVNAKVTWNDGRRYCRQRAGDLVKITNGNENQFIKGKKNNLV